MINSEINIADINAERLSLHEINYYTRDNIIFKMIRYRKKYSIIIIRYFKKFKKIDEYKSLKKLRSK